MRHHARRIGVSTWARRHVLGLSIVDNLLSAIAVAELGFLVGLGMGIAITIIIYEIEHWRRLRVVSDSGLVELDIPDPAEFSRRLESEVHSLRAPEHRVAKEGH